MADSPILPGSHSRPLAGDGGWSREWFGYFRSLQTYVTATTGNTTDLAALSASVSALDDRITTLEGAQAAVITGPQSVEVGGSLGAGAVSVRLRGDSQAPGNTKYYGTGPTGAKGWFSHAVSTLADVDLAGLVADDVLRYNGTTWVRQAVSDDAALLLADADVPRLGTVNTWALAQTFTVAPVFTNQSGTRSALGATTVGSNLFTAANPSAVRWVRVNADNTVTFRTAAETLADIGAEPAGAAAGVLTATITNGDATHAPTGDAVFDALALKTDLATSTAAGIGQSFGVVLTDLNVAMSTPPMFFSCANTAANIPSANSFIGIHVSRNANQAAQYVIAMATGLSYYRTAAGGVWGSWVEIANRLPRVNSAAASAAINPNTDTQDLNIRTAQSVALAINAPAGTAQQGQRFMFRIKDDGTSRALNWNAIYRGAMSAATVVGKTHYFLFIYNAEDTKWDMLSESQI